jgi:hypothetical protein
LVGVVKPDTTVGLFKPAKKVNYGEATTKLATLLKQDRAPQEQDVVPSAQSSMFEDEEDD